MTGITQVAAGLMGFGAAFAAAFFAAAEVLGRAFFAAFLAGVDFTVFTAAHGFYCASAPAPSMAWEVREEQSVVMDIYPALWMARVPME